MRRATVLALATREKGHVSKRDRATMRQIGGNTGSGGWKQDDNEREGGNQPGSEEGAGVMAMANGNGWAMCVDR